VWQPEEDVCGRERIREHKGREGRNEVRRMKEGWKERRECRE
jgi:hypothetical protein